MPTAGASTPTTGQLAMGPRTPTMGPSTPNTARWGPRQAEPGATQPRSAVYVPCCQDET